MTIINLIYTVIKCCQPLKAGCNMMNRPDSYRVTERIPISIGTTQRTMIVAMPVVTQF